VNDMVWYMEVSVAYFQILSWNLPITVKEYHRNPQSW